MPFSPYLSLFQQLRLGQHPQDGLRYASEPPTLASALRLVKIQVQGLDILPLIKGNRKDRILLRWTYCYRGLGSPPLHITTNLGAPEIPP